MTTTTKRVVLIDNYDSFTYNIYEYLCRVGAEVLVYRNDEITVEEIAALNPTNIMISPGPGHPKTDSGVSIPVIQHFQGKIPIFGVCMGLQCIVEAFGGIVGSAGEIIHGKTSSIQHNNQGAFRGVRQGVNVTRYHSLAAELKSLPDSLEVTATSDGGIIQGVRHKEFTIEAVQFHPESVISEEGLRMIQNFVELSGNTWSSAKYTSTGSQSSSSLKPASNKGSILDQIYAQRKKDIAELEATPGKSFENLEKSLAMGLAPKQLDFAQRLRDAETKMALLAEVKRASPSKGNINIDAHAASQALSYAKAGAAAISVLTEPHWFKGDIEDMRQARLAVESLGEKRPAILRKEFIFSKYQILEARLYGADTVLLIVKMLDDTLLKQLYDYSLTLKMEPLVEVASADEMKRAVGLGSKVIGVNNRDLHSFAVDMSTTSSLVKDTPEGTILCALSGIAGRDQVDLYAKEGVKAVLVGESLMRASDPSQFVHDLVG